MSIPTDTLPFFRTQWASRFTDTCVIKRRTGFVLNQTTGVNDPTYSSNYEGPCLVRPLAEGQAEAGQELVATHGYTVFVPHTETGHLPEDLIDVTSVTDLDLTGKQFVITNVDFDTYVTVRRLTCEEVVSG